MRNIIKHSDGFNEPTNTLHYKNIPLILYSRKGWCWLCVTGELETETDCYILTQSSLTIAALLSHPGWAAQPWVTEGPRPLSGAGSHSTGILSPTGTATHPSRPVAPGYIIVSRSPASCGRTHIATITKFNHVHRSRWYSDIFDLFRCSSAYLNRCISWLTARSRVSMLQVLLCINNNSIKHQLFVYTQLNDKTVQISVSTQYKYQTVLFHP